MLEFGAGHTIKQLSRESPDLQYLHAPGCYDCRSDV